MTEYENVTPFFFFFFPSFYLPVTCKSPCLSYHKQKATVLHLIPNEILQRKFCCLEVKKCDFVVLKSTTFYFYTPELDECIKATELTHHVYLRN